MSKKTLEPDDCKKCDGTRVYRGEFCFLRGQVVRYQWRLGRKGPAAEDAGKAAWYAERLVKELAKGKA